MEYDRTRTMRTPRVRVDPAQPRDTEIVWMFGIVGHAACPVLRRTRVHTFFMSQPGKAASLMPVGDHTYWAVALTGDDREVSREGQHVLSARFVPL